MLTYLDGSGGVGAFPAEIEEGKDGHADGEPVDKSHIVDEGLDVHRGEVQQ